jgi:hypothetical protein
MHIVSIKSINNSKENARNLFKTHYLLYLDALKGQCHEIVVKMSQWSSSLGLNLCLRTLFSV